MPLFRNSCVGGRAAAILGLIFLYFLVALADLALATPEDKKEANDLLTFSGQVFVLLGALLGVGGGLRYFIEPVLKRRHLRKVIGTGLWLSSSELRRHLTAIKATLASSNPTADEMRDSLKKIPSNDAKGRADWFVKDGYFCMITAYKIAGFSSWMKIYQTAVLRVLLTLRWSGFISELFQKFDAYKVGASQNTVLWYDYIDAIGEKIIVSEAEFSSPLGFSDFCKKYYSDPEFLQYFDQLHMFIHFLGRPDSHWAAAHQAALSNMIAALESIEEFIRKNENLLKNFQPQKRTITTEYGWQQPPGLEKATSANRI
jgi:hypothetical protein